MSLKNRLEKFKSKIEVLSMNNHDSRIMKAKLGQIIERYVIVGEV